MKLFSCQNCGNLLHFENVRCERCGMALGFSPAAMQVSALSEAGGVNYYPLLNGAPAMRYCGNARHDACNWLVEASSNQALCQACDLNQTIPDLSMQANLAHWQRLEIAKRRLVYTLIRLNLPVVNRSTAPATGLGFDFLADMPNEPDGRVLTGHASGLITINIEEADDAVRERARTAMGEPYRTLLGHLRHEVGHYYWERLVRDGGALDEFRAMFGDERADYAGALQQHYQYGAPPQWQERFISSYASTHPWEDWAECWAHYLHIIDTLETAYAFDLDLSPRYNNEHSLRLSADFDPYGDLPLPAIIEAWLPLTLAINSLNRSMGQPDLYPFVLSARVIDKLGFIHRLVHAPTPQSAVPRA